MEDTLGFPWDEHWDPGGTPEVPGGNRMGSGDIVPAVPFP